MLAYVDCMFESLTSVGNSRGEDCGKSVDDKIKRTRIFSEETTKCFRAVTSFQHCSTQWTFYAIGEFADLVLNNLRDRLLESEIGHFRLQLLEICKEARKCLFKGDCPINVKTRRFCPACRLAKCFQVGMRADLILDDDEKKERMQKVSEKKTKKGQSKPRNTASRSQHSMSHSTVCAESTTGHDSMSSPEQISNMVEQAWRSATEMNASDAATLRSPESFSTDSRWGQGDISAQGESFAGVVYSQNPVMAHESKTAVFTGGEDSSPPTSVGFFSPLTPANSTTPSTLYSPDMRQSAVSPPAPFRMQTQSVDLSLSASASSRTHPYSFSPFQHVPRDELPSDPYMYWRLSEEERCLLTQLSAAYQDTLLAVLKGSPPRNNIDKDLITTEFYLQECELEARNVISFSKRMEDFRQLRQDEQIALLKASTSQVLGIRSCALYIAEKDAYLTRQGYFTLEHAKMLLPNHPLHDPCVEFCRSVKSIVKNDVTLYALLHCVVLFDPCDDRVIDRQLINSIRDKYIILLRHYLESLYSYRHSERYLMALQENLIMYRNMCQEGKPLIKKFFPSIPNKLLVEVLDL